ncbi:MAG: DUF2851 family protein [Prevotellaceae bacterium]|jgi:hypothetical protein|nr:DUF2851 family protein [Prevotellaceae bacterium]
MTEHFIHYLWFGKLFQGEQVTSLGETVEIIDVGVPNTLSGPDVFNAKVRIGDTMWAGNVEFHVRASDWLQHHHQHDPCYDSVILHVVLINDATITRSNGTPIAQLTISYPASIYQHYQAMMQMSSFVVCAKQLASASKESTEPGLDRLVGERLEQKATAITHLLNQSTQHWEEAFYVILARSFGFGVNSDAFERLAKALPLTILGKHKNNLPQIEALLFGQAGWLQNIPENDPYALQLQQEYLFLQQKYSLTPIDSAAWKFFRIRPNNFPTVRVAQLAALIHSASKLFSKILEKRNYKAIATLFANEPSAYWTTHYSFGEPSVVRSKKLSNASIESLVTNTVVPFLYCYGKQNNLPEFQKRAFLLLGEMRAENNHITAGFAKLGIEAASAADSQALIQLKNHYCELNHCLHCPIMPPQTRTGNTDC